MVLINKQPKLSCHMASMPINDRRLIKTEVTKLIVVDLLLNVLPIVCRSSVFVLILLCITLCPF